MKIITPHIRDWLRWLFVDLGFFWVGLITLAAAVVFTWLCPWHDAESRSRWAGTALQLLGLGTTALGIQQTRRQFGHRTVFESLKAWYARRPQKSISIVTGTGSMLATGGDVVMGVGSTAAPAGSTIEERVKRLEEWIPLIEKRAKEIDDRAFAEAAARKHGDFDEQKSREAADAKLGKQLEMSATGGLKLSTVGLAWLVGGTLLAGFPPEVAALIGPTTPVTLHQATYTLHPNWPAILGGIYFLVAVGFSIFYGWKAIEILTGVDPTTVKGAQLYHQRWLNFLGSAMGWMCLWFVLIQTWHHIFKGERLEVGWGYAVLALVGFVGVTGYLPYTVVKIVNSVGELIQDIPKLFKPKE